MEYSESPFNWSQTKQIIHENKLGKFKRAQKDLLLYRRYRSKLKEQGISSLNKLLSDELGWIKVDDRYNIVSPTLYPLKAHSAKIFSHPGDIKITTNKFPYHFTNDILHLLVWTKVPIPNDPSSPIGDISVQTRHIINTFLTKQFIVRYGIDKGDLLWFRNWSELQSIKEFSHVHVLIKDLSEENLIRILDPDEVCSVMNDQEYIHLMTRL